MLELINALLPQTQCTRCGFPACLPYAQAIANLEVDINRCPPGGEELRDQLAILLNVPATPMDVSCGVVKPRQVALIQSKDCIGCTLCLPACPVDAIVGGPKRLHTIDAQSCTGCELCLAPCPVDCISMVSPAVNGWSELQRIQALKDFETTKTRRSNPITDDSVAAPTDLIDSAVSQKAAAQLVLQAALDAAQAKTKKEHLK